MSWKRKSSLSCTTILDIYLSHYMNFNHSYTRFLGVIFIYITECFHSFFQVRAIRNFDLESMMGFWYVVQYYASTEELPEYACMQSDFTFSAEDQHVSAYYLYSVHHPSWNYATKGGYTSFRFYLNDYYIFSLSRIQTIVSYGRMKSDFLFLWISLLPKSAHLTGLSKNVRTYHNFILL